MKLNDEGGNECGAALGGGAQGWSRALISTTQHPNLCDAIERSRAFGRHKKSKIGQNRKIIGQT